MRGATEHPFVSGAYVIVNRNYSSYSSGDFSADKVLKVHKTGRFTLASDPSEQWYASCNGWSDDKEWYGYRTKRDYGVYGTRLKLATPEALAEAQAAHSIREHQRRCRKIADAMGKPDKIDPAVSQQIIALLEPKP